MNCANCGKEVNEGKKFCSGCGTPVFEQAPVEEGTMQTAYQAPVAQQAPVSAQQTVAVAEEINEAPVGLTKKKKGGALKGMLAVLCCVAMFIFMFAGAIVMTVRSAIKSENVKAVVAGVDTAMMEEMLDEFSDESINDEESREIINEIVEESSIPKAFGEKLGEYGDYIRGGKKPGVITKKDIVKIFKQNGNVSELMFDLKSYDDETERYERFFEEAVEPELDKIYDDDMFNRVLDIARLALSIWSVVALAMLALVFAFLLFRTRVKKLGTLSWAGITCIVTGGIYILTFTAGHIITYTSILGGNMRNILSILLKNITLDAVIIGGSVLVAGVLMVLIRMLITKLKKA